MENSDRRYVMEWIAQLERRERNQWTTKKESDYSIKLEKQRFFNEMKDSRICKAESDQKELKQLLRIK